MCISHSDLQKRIEASVQVELDAREIKCPQCGYTWDSDEEEMHISYYGAYDPKDDHCPDCEAAVVIDETVLRTFEVTLKAAKPGGE